MLQKMQNDLDNYQYFQNELFDFMDINENDDEHNVKGDDHYGFGDDDDIWFEEEMNTTNTSNAPNKTETTHNETVLLNKYLEGIPPNQTRKGDVVVETVITRIGLNTDKAGMESVDVNKVNKIIYDLSKGSRFFKKSQKDDARVNDKVTKMMQKLEKMKREGVDMNFLRTIDNKLIKMEAQRDLTKCWLHVDMDAFYASVELRDRPDLVGKPVAVGGMDMLSTSSYEARKYGVRAAMPGFIAMQLCPSLIILPLNFKKYREASNITRRVFAQFDNNFEAYSLDEASLDITNYLLEHSDVTPEMVAEEIRQLVLLETKLTCSIGIAPNTRLAKICGDINKPNGLYRILPSREVILKFLFNLPVRKVPGVGKVTGKLLEALNITKCGDLYDNRVILFRLFSPSSAEFFMRVALGLGAVEHELGGSQKSISTERTFRNVSHESTLFQICSDLAVMLSESLKKKNNTEGKTITLKLKTADFDLRTRSVTVDRHISSADDILFHAKKLLHAEMPVTLRLMGLRMSGFRDGLPVSLKTQPSKLSFFDRQTVSYNSNFRNEVAKQAVFKASKNGAKNKKREKKAKKRKQEGKHKTIEEYFSK